MAGAALHVVVRGGFSDGTICRLGGRGGMCVTGKRGFQADRVASEELRPGPFEK